MKCNLKIKKGKQIIFFLAVFCLISTNLSAQYKVIGFEGLDTINLGNTTIKEGQIILPKGAEKYSAVQLIPTSLQYIDIEAHLKNLKKAYISKSVMLLNVERNYVVNNLDFTILYYSPLWRDYIQYWAGSYDFTATSQEQFASQFKDDILKTLARLVKQKQVQTAENLAAGLVNFMIQYGYDDAALQIVSYMQTVDNDFVSKNKNLNRILTSSQLIKYKIPPKIVGLKDNNYKNCLIIFFDSDCAHCQTEILKIIQNYNLFESKGIRIISIAADIDKDKYDKYSAKFPWKDKLCDFNGLSGENFSNYGVVGTPSIFLTDGEGKIIGNFPTFEEIIKNLNDK